MCDELSSSTVNIYPRKTYTCVPGDKYKMLTTLFIVI